MTTPAVALLAAAVARQTGLPVAEALASVDPPAAADAAALMRQGEQAVDAGQFHAAWQAFRGVLLAQPDHVGANLRLALLAQELGARERGLQHWAQVSAGAPELDQPFFEMARLYADGGQYDRAVHMLGRMHAAPTDAFWIVEAGRIRETRRAILRSARAKLAARRHGGLAAEDCLEAAGALTQLGFRNAALRLLGTLQPGAHPEQQALARFHVARRQSMAEASARLAAEFPAGERPEAIWLTLVEASFQMGRLDAVAQALADGGASAGAENFRFRVELARGNGQGCLDLARGMADARPRDTLPCQFALAALRALGALPAVGDATGQAAGRTIPAVLLQYWDQPEIPADVRQVMAGWHAPEVWRAVVFDGRLARQFIAERFPPATLAAFERCHHPAMRSDFLRLAWLSQEGGIYLDVDEACGRSPAAMLRAFAGHELVVAVLGLVTPYANNALVAAAPNHPVIRAALDAATRDLLAHADAPANVWDTTGPGLLTRSLVPHLLRHGTAGLGVLNEAEWRAWCVPCNTLGYKQSATGNWRLAGQPEAAGDAYQLRAGGSRRAAGMGDATPPDWAEPES